MFKVNDPVVHPGKGAGVVLDIKRMPRLKGNQRYYKIKIVGRDEKTTLMVPLKKAEEIGLRPAIPEANLGQVWEILSGQPLGLPAQHKKRYQLLKDKLSTGEVGRAAEVVRDLEWRRLQIRRLNVPGERIYKKAMRFLVGELAVSQGVEVQTVEEKVTRLLGESLSSHMVQ